MPDESTYHLEVETGKYRLQDFDVTLLAYASVAEKWFADAVREAERETEDVVGAIRREIVFVACFAESYIFEWARGIAGKEVFEYFDLEKGKYKKIVKDRWKCVPCRVRESGLIESKSAPSIDWGKMGVVMKYRNGLVHARPSIPFGLANKEDGDSAPPQALRLRELKKRGQGWALASVLEVVGQLHEHTGTPVPEYLEDYLDSGAS